MRAVGAYEAKTKLSQLLDDVAAGETIAITRRGTVVAVLSRPTAWISAGDAVDALRQDRRGVALGDDLTYR